MEANDKFFQFDLWGMTEGLQFTEYSAPDGQYDYHTDSMYNSNIRKLSASIQLSNPNDYEGGDLRLYNQNETIDADAIRQQGTVVMFPSFIEHQAEKVTKGKRYSLAAWWDGPCWR